MISIKNVNKWYGDFQVLTDCSTEVKKGEVVVVCGPAGLAYLAITTTVGVSEARALVGRVTGPLARRVRR